jgi:hypothetical protein
LVFAEIGNLNNEQMRRFIESRGVELLKHRFEFHLNGLQIELKRLLNKQLFDENDLLVITINGLSFDNLLRANDPARNINIQHMCTKWIIEKLYKICLFLKAKGFNLKNLTLFPEKNTIFESLQAKLK